MNIVYSSSNEYFKPTYVSIYSLLKNSSSTHQIILLSSKITLENKNKITKLVTENKSTIKIIEIDDFLEKMAKKFNLPKMRGNYSTYARIFLADLLPDLYDVLLIDSDTLVIGEIDNYMKQNIENVMCASKDYVILNKHSNHEDAFFSNTYYNMGILYVNLNKWRSLNLTSLFSERFDQSYKPKIADQSLINKYLQEYICESDLKFNFYTYFHYKFNYAFYVSQNKSISFVNEQIFMESYANPVILHFIGTWYERPWYKRNISSYFEIYKVYWEKCFDLDELYQTPINLSFKTFYDSFSYIIYSVFGLKMYYYFRYFLIQKLKKQ